MQAAAASSPALDVDKMTFSAPIAVTAPSRAYKPKGKAVIASHPEMSHLQDRELLPGPSKLPPFCEGKSAEKVTAKRKRGMPKEETFRLRRCLGETSTAQCILSITDIQRNASMCTPCTVKYTDTLVMSPMRLTNAPNGLMYVDGAELACKPHPSRDMKASLLVYSTALKKRANPIWLHGLAATHILGGGGAISAYSTLCQFALAAASDYALGASVPGRGGSKTAFMVLSNGDSHRADLVQKASNGLQLTPQFSEALLFGKEYGLLEAAQTTNLLRKGHFKHVVSSKQKKSEAGKVPEYLTKPVSMIRAGSDKGVPRLWVATDLLMPVAALRTGHIANIHMVFTCTAPAVGPAYPKRTQRTVGEPWKITISNGDQLRWAHLSRIMRKDALVNSPADPVRLFIDVNLPRFMQPSDAGIPKEAVRTIRAAAGSLLRDRLLESSVVPTLMVLATVPEFKPLIDISVGSTVHSSAPPDSISADEWSEAVRFLRETPKENGCEHIFEKRALLFPSDREAAQLNLMSKYTVDQFRKDGVTHGFYPWGVHPIVVSASTNGSDLAKRIRRKQSQSQTATSFMSNSDTGSNSGYNGEPADDTPMSSQFAAYFKTGRM